MPGAHAVAGKRSDVMETGPEFTRVATKLGPLKSTDGARTARVGAVTPTVLPARNPSAMRPWTTQYDGLQRYKVTHTGTAKKRPASARYRS
jgi:hypothetical protein